MHTTDGVTHRLTSSSPRRTQQRRSKPRVLRGAAYVVPTTVAVTAAVAASARTALDLDRSFPGTTPATVAATVAVVLTAGCLVFAATSARASRRWRFERIATAVFVISLIGPVTTLWSAPPDGPAHHRPQTMVTLIVLHLITYVGALALARRSRRGH